MVTISRLGVYQGRRRLTVSGEQRDSRPFGSGSTSAANAVDVILGIVWVVIIEDMSNVLDIFDGISMKPELIENA